MNDQDRAALLAALEAMGLKTYIHHNITPDDRFVCVRIYGESSLADDMLSVAAGDDGVGLLGRYQTNGFRAEVTKATSVEAMLQVFVTMIEDYEEYVGRMQMGLYD